MKVKLLSSFVAVAALAAAPAFGSTINTVVQQAASTSASLSGTVTAMLSKAGTATDTIGTTKSYTNDAELVNDGTGSIDVFGSSSLFGSNSTTVGNNVNVTGTFTIFDGIPEMETGTPALSVTSAGTTGSVPSPTVATIPGLMADNGTYASGTWQPTPAGTAIGEYLVTLNDVTLTDTGSGDNSVTSGVTKYDSSNIQLTLNDGSGNTMEYYYWESSYSVTFTNLGGTVINLNTPIDTTGFVATFGGVAQFTPLTLSPFVAPEPGALALMAVGGILAFYRRRRTR